MEKLNKMIKEVETLEDGFKVEKDILLIRLKECKEELHKQLTLTDVGKCDCGKINKNVPKDGYTYMCKCGKEI